MLRIAPKILLGLALIVSLLIPAARTTATGGVTPSADPQPVPIISPRLSPQPIPHSMVLDPYVIYNENLVPPPVQSIEANDVNGGAAQESPGRGIHQNNVKDNDEMHTHAVIIDDRDAARGLTLYPQADVCNDFNGSSHWSALDPNPPNDIWTDYYGGWAPYAIDEGLYQAKNVVFTMERSVGPGENYDKGYSAKISSNQPYAAGYGSPKIDVPPGAQVTVKVNYLIWDHDFKGLDYDWASMGVKADATATEAHYVNGYTRGQWAQLEHTVTAGPTGQIMVLLQGHSPAALNSNIYFDDVRIMVDGVALDSCVYATPAPETPILPPVDACIPVPSPASMVDTPDRVEGYINFEGGQDSEAIQSTIPGLEFTNTEGFDWVYLDVTTGQYRAPYPDCPYGSPNGCHYALNGNKAAWLGEEQGDGIITFTEEGATYLRVWVSAGETVTIDAYDQNDALVDSAVVVTNINTGRLTEAFVQSKDEVSLKRVIIRGTANYWLIDDLATDAPGVPDTRMPEMCQ